MQKASGPCPCLECNNQVNGPTLLGIEVSRYLSTFLGVSVRMFYVRMAFSFVDGIKQMSLLMCVGHIQSAGHLSRPESILPLTDFQLPQLPDSM